MLHAITEWMKCAISEHKQESIANATSKSRNKKMAISKPEAYKILISAECKIWPGSILFLANMDPISAAFLDEVTAESCTPFQRLRHAVVGAVPARIFHQGQAESRDHRVLCVATRHRLVLDQ